MKYFIHYVESCTPKLGCFNSKEECYDFIKSFGEKWGDHDSSWLDYAFETDNLVTFDKYWEKNHG